MDELNYGALFLGLLVSLLFTAVLYGIGPMIFLVFRKKAILNKRLILFCVLYTVSAWICWNAVSFFALDGEISNGGAAFIWGFGYYFLVKRVLKKRGLFDLQESDEQEEHGEPMEPKNTIAIILAVCLAVSLAGNALLAFRSNQQMEAAQEKISSVQQLCEKYKKENENVAEYLSDSIFLHENIGFVIENSPYYHDLNCAEFDAEKTWWAHNIGYCKYLGYSPCPECQ